MNDEQLIEKITLGGEEAFNQLYERYSEGLFTYLCRLMQNEVAAQDVLQEVFLVVWREGRRFRGDASVKSWMFRIAHHRAVSWIRKQKREVAWDAFDSRNEHLHLEEQVLEWQSAKELYQALNELSAEQRAVVELTYAYEMRQDEIGVVLNCPVGTVKSRLNAALHRLGGILQRMAKTAEQN